MERVVTEGGKREGSGRWNGLFAKNIKIHINHVNVRINSFISTLHPLLQHYPHLIHAHTTRTRMEMKIILIIMSGLRCPFVFVSHDLKWWRQLMPV